MAGAFDWLDTLAASVGTVAGKAVDAAANLATVKATAGASADQTPAAGTSPLQTAVAGTPAWMWAAGAVVLLGVGYLVLRKK